MTKESDIKEEINNEWVELLNHLKENFSVDYNTLQHMNKKHGELSKQLFEQGYRSGWNGATDTIKESIRLAQPVH